MNVLFLGYDRNQTSLLSFLENEGCKISSTALPLVNYDPAEADIVISYGYRHILKQDFLNKLKRPAINLHMSYLPYNRGAHPNFWAWYEGTPHGVTIHHIDAGVDTGDIVAQKEIYFSQGDHSFEFTYNILSQEIENLFKECWPLLVARSYKPFPQQGLGSLHRIKDLPTGIEWHQSITKTVAELKKEIT